MELEEELHIGVRAREVETMKSLLLFGTTEKEDTENRKKTVANRSLGRRHTLSRKSAFAETAKVLRERERGRVRIKSSQKGSAGAVPLVEAVVTRSRSPPWAQAEPNPRLSNPPQHIAGEQVAAGWPAWLCAEAGEVLNGWIPRRADSFEKL
eukprot:c4960_g2_i1 orf=96-551(+)